MEAKEAVAKAKIYVADVFPRTEASARDIALEEVAFARRSTAGWETDHRLVSSPGFPPTAFDVHHWREASCHRANGHTRLCACRRRTDGS